MDHHRPVWSISVNQIAPDPDSPHGPFRVGEDDGSLRDSVRAYGFLNPIVVCHAGRDRYFIIDGERRYRIARDLGIQALDCVVCPAMDGAEREVLRFQLYRTFKPLPQADQARQRRRLRGNGISPRGEAA